MNSQNSREQFGSDLIRFAVLAAPAVVAAIGASHWTALTKFAATHCSRAGYEFLWLASHGF